MAIQFRRGPQAAVAGASVVDGEPLWATDEHRLYICQGGTKYEIGGTASPADGDKGDITVSSSGATWTIDAGVVTPAKMADGAARSVLGRAADSAGVRADIAVPEASTAGVLAYDPGPQSIAWAQPPDDSKYVLVTTPDPSVAWQALPLPLLLGGTGAELDTPGADRMLFWDESGAGCGWLQPTNSIEISGAQLKLAGDSASPGANRAYGTDASGDRGWLEPQIFVTMPSVLFSAPIATNVSSMNGVLTATLHTQPANRFFAGPSTGANATPTFRAIVAADIGANVIALTSIAQIATTRLLGRSTAGTGDIEQLTVGAGLSLSGGSLSCTVVAVSDGDKGDITVSSSGTVWSIDAGVVTYSKIQATSAASVLLGRGAGSGAGTIQELTLGSGLSLSGTTLLATGSGGTVTSVAMTVPSFLSLSGSPITTSGTLAVTLATQAANRFFSGPTTGADATPTFRAIVAADIGANVIALTSIAQISAARLLGRSTAGTGDIEQLTVGAGLSLSGGTLSSTATGTVTSVAMTVPSFLSLSGSPITTSGTLAVTLATQSANLIFAGPTSGGAATPHFRPLAAADIGPNVVALTSIAQISTAKLLGRSSAGAGDIEQIGIGTGLSFSGGNLFGTGGTVTSVGLIAPAQFTVSGSPVVSSGSIILDWDLAAQNTILAGPSSGSSGVPSFRSLVAADIPTLAIDVKTSGNLAASRRTHSGCLCSQASFAVGNVTSWVNVGGANNGTVVTFDTETWDTDAYHSTSTNTSRLTVPTTGYYRFWGTIQRATDWRSTSLNNTNTTQLRVRKNGLDTDAGTLANIMSTTSSAVEISGYASLTAGDYIELIAWQNSGASRTCQFRFGIELIGV